MEYNHAYDWSSSTTVNPAYGWDSVSPDRANDFIARGTVKEHGQTKTQAEQQKMVEQKTTTRRKCVLVSCAVTAIVLFLVLVFLSFGIAITLSVKKIKC